MSQEAVVGIDMQRGFSVATARYPRVRGYGELPVPGVHEIIPVANKIYATAALNGITRFTTQDWHPAHTAHFAPKGQTPNNRTNFNEHCVINTPGAEFHEDLYLPAGTLRFLKGMEILERGEDDTSFSGFNAVSVANDLTLPKWLDRKDITKVTIFGDAAEFCVRATGLDFNKAGYEVTAITDVIAGLTPEGTQQTLNEFAEVGIQLMTSEQWLGRQALTLEV